MRLPLFPTTLVLACVWQLGTGYQPSCCCLAAELNAEIDLENLPVAVKGMLPVPLVDSTDSEAWSEVPVILRGALIFSQPQHAGDGSVRFRVERDTMVCLAASWAYDGNSSGGWTADRLTKQDLVAQGWLEAGKMYRQLHDRHTVFVRFCRAGESFHLRTRKYNAPLVAIPQSPRADRPTMTSVERPTGVVDVAGSDATPIEQLTITGQIPTDLQGATACRPRVPVAVVSVNRHTPVYVAASWQYDGGRRNAQWPEEVWSLEDFQVHGWRKLGPMEIDGQSHELLVRDCNPGERFRLRTRKYNAPLVFFQSN